MFSSFVCTQLRAFICVLSFVCVLICVLSLCDVLIQCSSLSMLSCVCVCVRARTHVSVCCHTCALSLSHICSRNYRNCSRTRALSSCMCLLTYCTNALTVACSHVCTLVLVGQACVLSCVRPGLWSQYGGSPTYTCLFYILNALNTACLAFFAGIFRCNAWPGYVLFLFCFLRMAKTFPKHAGQERG